MLCTYTYLMGLLVIGYPPVENDYGYSYAS